MDNHILFDNVDLKKKLHNIVGQDRIPNKNVKE